MKYYVTEKSVLKEYPKSPFNEVEDVMHFYPPVLNEEIGAVVYGYIVYRKPIHPEWAEEYQLIPEPSKILKVEHIGTDMFGCHVYKDTNGSLWKYIEPGDSPASRHDVLYRASGNCAEGEPFVSMDAGMDYRIILKTGEKDE